MAITAAMVKELRERTGAGMMECKKALTDTDGDIDVAVEELRKRGAAQADKKAGRIAAEGVIIAQAADKVAVLVEVNCETDFVAKDESFVAFAEQAAATVLSDRPADIDALKASVEKTRLTLVGKLGENINVRRFQLIETAGDQTISSYQHGSRIAVLVASEGGRDDLGHDLALHIAASAPICVSADQVPQATIDKEREIYSAQAAESGKPAEIMEKMVEGRIRKYLNEVTLVGQPFVKDPDQTIEKLLETESAKVSCFVRYEVGEGIDKKVDDFVAEVMAQAKG
jgi:elongation factor Ts